jgi:dolichol-phosphate mannosyltransferase
MSIPSFVVVIPMYNEVAGAKKCIVRVLNSLKKIKNRSLLIVVNDGSNDGTHEVLKNLKILGLNFKYLKHEINKGYGKALQTGIKVGVIEGFDYILFMDSDLTNNPKDIFRFVEKMNESADVIKATRYSNGGQVVGVAFYKRLISYFGNKLAKLLFQLPITDCTNGFRAIKLNLLRNYNFRENDFSFIMEELFFLSNKKKLKFSNIPVTLNVRTDDLRLSSFQYSFKAILKYLKYPLKALKLKIFLINK